MSGSAAVATFHTVRAEYVAAPVVSTKRLDLEGVAVNGLMVQKLLKDSSGPGGTSEDFSAAIAALTALVHQLQTTAAALSAQVSTISTQITGLEAGQATLLQNVATLTSNLSDVAADVAANAQLLSDHDDYITKLKATTYFVGPF